MGRPARNWEIQNKFALSFLCILAIGCATSNAPNISAIYRIPALSNQLQSLPATQKSQTQHEVPLSAQELFVQLYNINPVLAMGVGKLPEFQDKINDLQVRALSRLLELLTVASIEEKSNLNKFLEVGQPNFRRYCSPLQAVFWLLEKEEYNIKESPLTYSLDTLLKKSWIFSDVDRWQDYEVVTDRLNAPDLIIYYEVRAFNYEFRRSLNGDPRALFRTKRGHCIDAADFTVYCLEKGGYSASVIKVKDPNPGNNFIPHYATLVKIDGNSYIIDNWPFGITLSSQYKRD